MAASCWKRAMSYRSAKRNLHPGDDGRPNALDRELLRIGRPDWGLDGLGPGSPGRSRSGCGLGHIRRRVIFGVLIIMILWQRRIDEVEDNAGHVHLSIVKQLQRLFDQSRGSISKAHNEQ